MSDVGITGFGAYVPRARLRRSAIAAAQAWANPGLRGQAKGERAVCGWDEDVVTMAVEAGRDALTGVDRSSISALVLASTSPPFADRLNAGIVAGALDAPASVTAFDLGGSMRAGASALIAGLALAAGGGQSLVVASEKRGAKPASIQEIVNGDAAAAILLGADRPIARVLASESLTADFVDHFRAAGRTHDYGWEERWVREEGYLKLIPATVAKLLRRTNVAAKDITRFLLPTPMNAVAASVAKKLGVADTALADPLISGCGYSGAAHSLLMLVHALESARPGDTILLTAFGNGCDAILLEVTPEIEKLQARRGVAGSLARGMPNDDYMRFLSFNDEIGIDWGMRAEFGNKYALTTEWRSSRDNLAFLGGRDRQTGVVQFPKTPKAVAPGATGIAEYEDVALADQPAKVISFTADNLTYHPSPPLYFGLVQFDNGARLMMEFVDVAPGALVIGAPLEMVFRIKEIDHGRGYRHYFWKATPIAAAVGVKEAAQ